ncbi:MAG: D-alanyl-D-alanine carboxypeptidase [Eubacteriaceae bacterium]|nr:D-alanyl-D-alanine carboxypeptidase [Eubacteriaceae bacterium]
MKEKVGTEVNRKKTVSILIALIVIMTSCMPVYAKNSDDIKLDSECAIVYCENTGEVVYSKNIHERIEPFSITKLMTAMLAIQNVPLDKVVKVPYEATLIGESTMGLVEGEKVTVKDLLYGAMLNSGNDACYTLAVAVSGSEEEFVKLMNKTAKNIGCKETSFANSHGMRAKKHYTTAYDMMLISKTAFANDTLAKISGTKTYKMGKTNKSDARVLKNHIEVIQDSDNYIQSAKTGTWDEDHCGISVYYNKDGLKLVAVILGAKMSTRTDDITKLVNAISDSVEGVKVVGKNKVQGKIRIKHGAKTRLEVYTREIGYAFVPKEASESLIRTEVVLDNDVTAPVKKGDVVGCLEIYAADDLVNKVDLIVKEDVAEGWFPSYFGISNFTTVVICVVGVLILCIYIWIVIERAKAKRRKALRRKQQIERIAMEQLRREEDHKVREWRF